MPRNIIALNDEQVYSLLIKTHQTDIFPLAESAQARLNPRFTGFCQTDKNGLTGYFLNLSDSSLRTVILDCGQNYYQQGHCAIAVTLTLQIFTSGSTCEVTTLFSDYCGSHAIATSLLAHRHNRWQQVGEVLATVLPIDSVQVKQTPLRAFWVGYWQGFSHAKQSQHV